MLIATFMEVEVSPVQYSVASYELSLKVNALLVLCNNIPFVTIIYFVNQWYAGDEIKPKMECVSCTVFCPVSTM